MRSLPPLEVTIPLFACVAASYFGWCIHQWVNRDLQSEDLRLEQRRFELHERMLDAGAR